MQVKRSYRFASGRPVRASRAPQVSLRVSAFSAASWFKGPHPLAATARARCAEAGHVRPRHGACGQCWESAVRDDERFVVECGLSRELTAAPADVDEVAVDRACRGESVPLTGFEVAAAVAVLRGRGLTVSEIGTRLRRDARMVGRILAAQAAEAAAAQEAEATQPTAGAAGAGVAA